MSFYCYRNGDKRIERQYPMGTAPKTVEEDGLVFERDWGTEILSQSSRVKGSAGPYYKGLKVKSIAMGCHPTQVAAAKAEARRRGVTVDFDNRGVALFDSRKQKKQYAEAFGFYDTDGGYGDAQKSSKHLNYQE